MSKIDPFDLSIRFPAAKKWMKLELVRIAAENGLTMTHLVTMIIEDWFGKSEGKINLKLKV